MKILVIGGGGREWTLCWKIGQSPLVDQIFCAPGNVGTNNLPKCRNILIKPMETEKLLNFALARKIDLTVVGPEDPLVMGIADLFTTNGLVIVGPDRKAAIIEGSKIFAKEFMLRHNVPTAKLLGIFTSPLSAIGFIESVKLFPIVIKADGLAAGKGVKVCGNIYQARAFIHKLMIAREFGSAGRKILIEECLDGKEASFLAFTDGEHILPMPSSQDHKPVNDNDQGENTGGMGAYSPAPVVTPEIAEQAMNKIMLPTVRGMKKEGRLYQGILYAGLMIKNGEAKVLEFNARFGDPETQVQLPRMKNDLVPILMGVANGDISSYNIGWDPRPCVCVVMASGGYPEKYRKGHIISGLEQAKQLENIIIVHAGTAADSSGRIITNGGRVLGVTALGPNISAAIKTAYQAVNLIHWPNEHHRRDIGQKA